MIKQVNSGHALMSVNGQTVTYKELPDGRDVFDVIADKANYPLNLKFGRPKITTNEKIVLASMFYPLYALAVQLSPDVVRLLWSWEISLQQTYSQGSSGIKELETDTFKLHCNQTLTGVKFIVVTDRSQQGVDQLLDKVLYIEYLDIMDNVLLAQIYELYSDYALKNPFYSLEMPIRADLFEEHLQVAIDQIERTGFI